MKTVTLPFPDMRLSSNSTKGLHWGAVHKMRKKARGDAFTWTASQVRCPFSSERVKVSVIFSPPDRRARNADNVISANKSVQDGVADAIGIPDERWDVEYKFGPVIKGGQTIYEIEVMG